MTVASSAPIIAVIVTYNRLELLKKAISGVLGNKGVTALVVVDNGCTDGTSEWLDANHGENVFVIHQDNVGGSGGFYRGMKEAYNLGAEYVWCMDDDVYPQADCLENLLAADTGNEVGILCPCRIMDDNGDVFVTECVELNFSNPFASMHAKKLTPQQGSDTVDIQGMVFEGPLIKRSVIDAIGFPEKDLFIFYDDTDYSYRAVLAGFRVLYVPDAKLVKARLLAADSWSVRQQKKKWKRNYQIRNCAYFNRKFGTNPFVRYIRPLNMLMGYVLPATFLFFLGKYNAADIAAMVSAYRNGMRGKLGKI